MKKLIYISLACLLAYSVHATHYEITTNSYTAGLTLQTGDSIYMTDGGFGSLTLFGESTAVIEGTSILEQFTGGIWYLNLSNTSDLYMTGGQVNEINIGNDATAVLKGGLIKNIWSTQLVSDPHITLYHSGPVPTVQKIEGLDFLAGQWGNGDPFSIYLHDTGYNVYGNFNFILVPEPITFALLFFGGLLLRKKAKVKR